MAEYELGAVYMVTCLTPPSPFAAVRDHKGWNSLDPGIGFAADSDVTEARRLYLIDIPDIVSGTNEAKLFVRNLRVGAHHNSTTARIANQIEAQIEKPYRERSGNLSAPWPIVPECHSGNDDTHECPQCSWDHEHDWVMWVDPGGPSWPPNAKPIRCSKCGGRKCDLKACDKQRHTHDHQGDS